MIFYPESSRKNCKKPLRSALSGSRKPLIKKEEVS